MDSLRGPIAYFLLKANKDDFCFISCGTIFQIFGPEYEMVSCPFHTVFAVERVS